MTQRKPRRKPRFISIFDYLPALPVCMHACVCVFHLAWQQCRQPRVCQSLSILRPLSSSHGDVASALGYRRYVSGSVCGCVYVCVGVGGWVGVCGCGCLRPYVRAKAPRGQLQPLSARVAHRVSLHGAPLAHSTLASARESLPTFRPSDLPTFRPSDLPT